MRLLVRIARQRQSIIRVSPDVPLSTIFQTICDKLHLSEEARAGLEFRHPTQNELTLQPKLTLSQYNLRELYLADKQGKLFLILLIFEILIITKYFSHKPSFLFNNVLFVSNNGIPNYSQLDFNS